MRLWGKGNPGALLVGMQVGAATVENSMELPQKIKHGTGFDPVIPLLGLYLKNPETPIQKNLCTPMFIVALFTIVKCWKQPNCPQVNEWMKKLWYIYTMEYYTVETNKELLTFMVAWMELESIMLNEVSQEVKDKYHMISPLMEPNQQNKQASKIQPETLKLRTN